MIEALREYWSEIEDRRISSLFETPNRAETFSARLGDLLLDYSKTNIDTRALWFLSQWFNRAEVERKRNDMFSGRRINETEGRAVLHIALRNLDGAPITVRGKDIMPGVRETLARMTKFARSVRDGSFGLPGGQVTDVVNIGIGGSDLGPAMAAQALLPYHDGPRCHFVSNIDPAHIADTLKPLNPATTLVIVASKTFTTIETMTNAATARAWLSEKVETPAEHFVALSSAVDKTEAFGIPAERVFGFEDWVGGRYSLWGPIGLSLMIAIGPDAFKAMLRGAQAMDHHFHHTHPKDNMPVLLALVGIWHNQVGGYPTRAVLPYDQRLGRLPAYLQQLEMESNGKSVVMDGTGLDVSSGPVVWGEPGTNGQHAFYQLIHQGKTPVPCEFLVAAEGHEDELKHQHHLLLANCFAQSEALMRGRTIEEATEIVKALGVAEKEVSRQAAHRVFPGNRPSVTLIYPKLTPEILGQIISLYEHRVFVEGAMLGINSFDQWGVELGKELAKKLEPMVRGEESADGKDGSTRQLIEFVRTHSG